MWNPLKTDVLDRFKAVEDFFRATRGNGRDIEQTAKGLAFVHMYAAYEYTVRAVVRTAVDHIVSHRHTADTLLPSLMALFLDPDLSRVRDCKKPDIWPARIRIFENLFSGYPANVHNTVFPVDGSHFRQGQLQTIFTVFGIKRLPARRRSHLRKIDEVVDHRNKIAHGEELAATIGGRYSRPEIVQTIQQVKSVCLLLISEMEKHCSSNSKHCR